LWGGSPASHLTGEPVKQNQLGFCLFITKGATVYVVWRYDTPEECLLQYVFGGAHQGVGVNTSKGCKNHCFIGHNVMQIHNQRCKCGEMLSVLLQISPIKTAFVTILFGLELNCHTSLIYQPHIYSCYIWEIESTAY